MAYYASKVIEIAEAELGYLEKASNKNLDSKTENAGYNNYTKYARDLHKAGYYQASKQGYAWCDMFVDWCFLQLCDGDADKAQAIICQTGPYGAGCGPSSQYYKNKGRFFADPKPGDQIFFWDSKKTRVAHTGLVYKVGTTYVYTIEGNTSSTEGVEANGGGVFKKKYKLTNGRIYGYGRPLYDEETKKEETVETESKKWGECKVTLPVLKKGYVGASAKALQILLIGNGYSCGVAGVDGSFGGDTLKAVKAYQKDKGLEVDGSVGPATWASLLK
jgi:hypothetical protein